MEIRLGRHDDFATICKLDSLAQQDPQRQHDIQKWLMQKQCYLLEKQGLEKQSLAKQSLEKQGLAKQGDIVAYAVLNRCFFGYDFIELVMVAVQHRRQGHAERLLQYFQEIAQTEKLFTSTNQSNLAMQQLLHKLNFQASGYIENLDDNDPELIYCYFK